MRASSSHGRPGGRRRPGRNDGGVPASGRDVCHRRRPRRRPGTRRGPARPRSRTRGATGRWRPTSGPRLFQQAMTLDEEITLVGGQGMGAAPHTGGTYAIPRLGLREVYLTDGPVGVRQGKATAMPIPMALAATFDPALATRYGRDDRRRGQAQGQRRRLRADGQHHAHARRTAAPTRRTARRPSSSRRTGVAWIRGAQSTGVIADVKHFAGQQPGGPSAACRRSPRSTAAGCSSTSTSTDRTLREIYLPQFEAAVKQGRRRHDHVLLQPDQRLLRLPEPATPCRRSCAKEWGFKGIGPGRLRRLQGHRQRPQPRPRLRALPGRHRPVLPARS